MRHHAADSLRVDATGKRMYKRIPSAQPFLFSYASIFPATFRFLPAIIQLAARSAIRAASRVILVSDIEPLHLISMDHSPRFVATVCHQLQHPVPKTQQRPTLVRVDANDTNTVPNHHSRYTP